MNTRKTMDTLNELLETVESCYMTVARENNLTYNALMLMLMVDYYDKLTQKQVCDELFLPKSSVHSMLSDLIARGYLKLTAGGNKKEKYIVPTDSGAKFIKKVVSETEQMENGALKSISDTEIAAFTETAKKLAKQMKAEAEHLYKGGDAVGD